MQKSFYLLLFGFFTLGVFIYLVNYALVPKTETGELNTGNLFIVSLVLLGCFTSFFSFIHVIIDKLFFKKFYQGPRIAVGIRRGIVFGITILSVAYIKILEYWTWYNAILVIVMGMLVEVVLGNIFNSGRNVHSQEVKNQNSKGKSTSQK